MKPMTKKVLLELLAEYADGAEIWIERSVGTSSPVTQLWELNDGDVLLCGDWQTEENRQDMTGTAWHTTSYSGLEYLPLDSKDTDTTDE